ncbi:MAG TPA: IS630 family transposase [Terracidiphilus sp.]|nr:IS630 family transposase [Terracidiphilus sp.]
MRAYSNDLRERIVTAVERGEHSLRELAHLFSVSLTFVVRLLQRRRQTGAVQPRPHAGGQTPKLNDADYTQLRQLIREQPDATLAELRAQLGVSCSLTTIFRALRKLRITRKKKTQHAQEQDSAEVQAQRAAFEANLASVDPEHLVFVDEMGANTAMTRTHGRAPAGERVSGSAPGSWQNVTLIVGLRCSGVVAPLAFEGATDQLAFQTYVEEVLVPTLQPGDVVVWDNLQAHKDREVIRAIESVGATVKPLPVYSPDETPIEEMFSKTKEYLRSVAARTTETVIAAMGVALQLVTISDIQGWFHDRAAYAMQK